ncbi:MAG TPA: hypothetical protein VGS08_04940 [Candidatus Saccharimonadales bacterium]|nr:hypothetical protein [Candidatus Saccharimonadales bacterium]
MNPRTATDGPGWWFGYDRGSAALFPHESHGANGYSPRDGDQDSSSHDNGADETKYFVDPTHDTEFERQDPPATYLEDTTYSSETNNEEIPVLLPEDNTSAPASLEEQVVDDVPVSVLVLGGIVESVSQVLPSRGDVRTT